MMKLRRISGAKRNVKPIISGLYPQSTLTIEIDLEIRVGASG